MEPSRKSGAAAVVDQLIQTLAALVGGLLALLGGIVTLFAACLLGAYALSRISGGPPQPNLAPHLLLWLIFGAGPLSLGVLLLRKTTPPRLHWLSRLLLGVVVAFAVLGFDACCGPKNWHTALRRQKMLAANAGELRGTYISPHLEAEIIKGTNLLWCGTFQLCWNEACRLTGGGLQLTNALSEFGLTPPSGELPMVTALNKQAFTSESIDEASYVALAGFVTNAIHDRIERAIKEKFHDRFKPRFVPDRQLTPRPQDVVAYACLYKNLSFPVPFERLEEELRFDGRPVRAFGIGATKASHDKMYPQLQILDYQSKDDFVVELKSKSEGDRLILAKIQPLRTLGDTAAGVLDRIERGKPEPTLTNDVLIVPRMNFDLTRTYSELQGLLLVPRNPAVSNDLLLVSAVQNTRFEMNEKGVELASEAHMAFACSQEAPPVRQHIMVFNKPFLLLMQRQGAKVPYFALWVDNAELLVPR